LGETKSEYKQIFKATSLFGGVQVFKIMISLINSKIIAVFLGTEGLGVLGLYNSTVSMVKNISSFGISFGAIRDISNASESDDHHLFSKLVNIYKKWVWVTGVLGMLVMLSLSKYLSFWTFESYDYTFTFILLSVSLLFLSLTDGQSTILRCSRRLKELAVIGILGPVLGLLLSVPFYFFLGIKGIVPSLVSFSIISFIVAWFFARKVPVKKLSLTMKDSFFGGFSFAKIGLALTAGSLIASIIAYFLNLIIVNIGGEEELGLYKAGLSITNQYIGLVFTAMGVDFFPRLSGLSSDNKKVRSAVNYQSEITVLIVTPILVLLIISTPLAIRLFFTAEFLPAIIFIKWAALGAFFKAISWPIGYISLSKGDSKVYFYLESIYSNIAQFSLNLYFYYMWGLEGLGVSYLICFILYTIIVYKITNTRYSFSWSFEFKKIALIMFVLLLITFNVSYFMDTLSSYIWGALAFLVSAAYALFVLNKKLDIKSFIKRLLKKKKNKE